MPGGDRTGPLSQGAMTGRGAGYCAGLANTALGRGFGMGYGGGYGARNRGFGGGGRGRRTRYFATGLPGRMRFGGNAAFCGAPTPYQHHDPNLEKQALRQQANALQSELDVIKKRLNEIEGRAAAD